MARWARSGSWMFAICGRFARRLRFPFLPLGRGAYTRKMRVCPNCGEENPEEIPSVRILRGETRPGRGPQAARKLVTIVFCDLAGSTSLGETLDSESLRAVMTRYFEEMRGVLESHGGVVEKYIGDAVMAVFGLPVVREDDALRAVAAADGMRAALERLNDELEDGLGRPADQPHRREHGRGGGRGSDRRRASRRRGRGQRRRPTRAGGGRNGDPDRPLDLPSRPRGGRGRARRAARAEGKGRAGPCVPAPGPRPAPMEPLNKRAPRSWAGTRAAPSPREHMLATAEGHCRLATVLGDAGVGKSRLLAALNDSLAGCLLLRGRCLAYGRGITFWPLREAVRQAAAISDDETPDAALEKLRQLAVPRLGRGAVERVASAIGLSGAQFPVHEVFWGARKLVEAIAARRAARARLRRRPLGRDDLPRVRRPPRAGGRGTGVARLPRATRVPRVQAGLG